MLKTNGLMTFAGILSAVSTGMLGIPFAVSQYYAQIVKAGPPEWWNVCVFPVILFGLVGNMAGLAVMGVAGKGQDQHSTVAQVNASSAVARAAVQEQQAEAPVIQVQVQPPPEVKKT